MKINDLYQIIYDARDLKASDIHLTVGLPTVFRIHGVLTNYERPISDNDIYDLILSMLNNEQQRILNNGDDLDFALQTPEGLRCRVNVFRAKGQLGAVLRILNSDPPSLDDMHLPAVLKTLVNEPRGLILVTGPTGSGKSTTLAAMINEINNNKPVHILTIEDPIEYVYKQNLATIRQREVGTDVKNFQAALRSALREDPDVILIGEMRDYETISLALTAAETGHLVMGTLHTTSAPQTIDRIIDACPPHAQEQVRAMLATTLRGVVCQCLVPLAEEKGRVAATEILIGTDAAMNLIRTNKCHQLISTMQMGKALGMHTLNSDLARLVREKVITKEAALEHSVDKSELSQTINDSMIF